MVYEVESGSVDVDVLSAAGGEMRTVHYSTGFSVDELSARIEWGEGTLCVTCDKGHEWGTAVEISTWVGKDRRAPRPRKPGSPPVPPADVRNVQLGERSRGSGYSETTFIFSDAETVNLSDGALETACVAALSDLLCGAETSEVMSACFAGSPRAYRTFVAHFPPTAEGDRHGMFLLCSESDASSLRVRGQCRGFQGDYFYEASARGDELLSWWGSDEWIVRDVASRLMVGVPAPYVLPSGRRGGYQVSARESGHFVEDDRQVELRGAERVVARQLASWVDIYRDAHADRRWAEASPIVWPGLSQLVDEQAKAENQQEELENELRGCLALGEQDSEGNLIEPWIFHQDISYDDVVYDLYF